MPTYTYHCPSCHNETTQFHGMNDTPRVLCRVCHKVCVKLYGAGAPPIFKGPGFYCNDSKGDEGK